MTDDPCIMRPIGPLDSSMRPAAKADLEQAIEELESDDLAAVVVVKVNRGGQQKVDYHRLSSGVDQVVVYALSALIHGIHSGRD